MAHADDVRDFAMAMALYLGSRGGLKLSRTRKELHTRLVDVIPGDCTDRLQTALGRYGWSGSNPDRVGTALRILHKQFKSDNVQCKKGSNISDDFESMLRDACRELLNVEEPGEEDEVA